MKNIVMTQKHKDFILHRLIPFILQEQGKGFAMSSWKEKIASETPYLDGIIRKPSQIPSCGSVCCIGGSVSMLKKFKKGEGWERSAKAIGLSRYRGLVLFFNWTHQSPYDSAWPSEYIARFEKAKTPLQKAKVAVSLLKAVVKTEGKILDTTPKEETC